VFLTYVLVGVFGYIGFLGTTFIPYFEMSLAENMISQNCLMMFEYTNVPAFIMSVVIFCLLFSTYPLHNHFLKGLIKILFWKNEEVSRCTELLMVLLFQLIPLVFALFYPDIGTILSYAGAVSGLLIIYILPVMVHVKRMKLAIENPLSEAAIAENEFKVDKSNPLSP